VNEFAARKITKSTLVDLGRVIDTPANESLLKGHKVHLRGLQENCYSLKLITHHLRISAGDKLSSYFICPFLLSLRDGRYMNALYKPQSEARRGNLLLDILLNCHFTVSCE
jgi:hypothetical protein